MGRGILAGLVWGTVVGFGIVTVANQVVDKVYVSPVSLSPEPANDAAMPQDRGGDVADAPEVADVSDTAEMSDAPAPQALPQTLEAQDPETQDPRPQEPQVSNAQPVQPDTRAQTDAAPAVEAFEDTNAADRTAAQPGETSPEAQSYTPPNATDIAAPQPIVEAPDKLTAPNVQTTDTPDVAGDSPVLNSPQSVELIQPDTDAVPMQIETTLPGQKPTPLGTPVTSPVGTAVTPNATPPADSADEPTVVMPETASEPVPAQIPEMQPTPKIAPQGQKAIGNKVGSFTDRKDTMKSTRLPSMSKSAMEDAAPVISATDLPAIMAFSADYTKTGTAPEMSVILVDIGDLDPNSPQLANLPFPVTFAVDALAPGASERAQMYRTAGLEVLALIGLPEGATAQDVAVTINQARDLVPVSIGFLDVPSASFQASRDVAAQVVASAGSSGHGIVSFSRGLNALMQESTRAKQPAALVFRDFDGRDQNISAIKRFLDQAAFRAGIDEDIVLVGRAKEDTVAALVEWSLGNRAATVELVPVSFLLTGGGTPQK
ncbi:MAG: polysaccharide deacetylase 2 family uncharacterized protein YibQ [Celeribacter sp.]|jgi:polysaccharide deacetylase 2 family uncharacterized protein YibQ